MSSVRKGSAYPWYSSSIPDQMVGFGQAISRHHRFESLDLAWCAAHSHDPHPESLQHFRDRSRVPVVVRPSFGSGHQSIHATIRAFRVPSTVAAALHP
jgi:hypothetical protein